MNEKIPFTVQARRTVEHFSKKQRTALLTLLFTDIAGSTRLLSEMGDFPASTLIGRHNEIIRTTLSETPDATEVSTAGDSFFIVFARPSDAARFALQAQARLRRLIEEEKKDFGVKIGIHLGEVVVEDEAGGGTVDVLGAQVHLTSRLTALANGGQILMSHGVFDNARQILKGRQLQDVGRIAWVSHGAYSMKGFDEPVTICETGEIGKAPLSPPADSRLARRLSPPGAEPVLGWRPAIEQPVPGTEWILEKKLGEGGFGEVWRASHRRTRELRVFKFCFRADRLRSLKREVTLFRMLKEVLGVRPDIARLCDVQFEEPPYYLELEYTPGGDLSEWIENRGGFDGIPLDLRLEVVAQVAAALAAAHSVGVIHKDVKPSNILLEEKSDGSVQARLTDFGIGQLTDREALKRAGITATGFTETLGSGAGWTYHSGTHLYMAPELVAGRPSSIQSDVYSLGVLLFQMIVGDLRRPVATDWERAIDDPLLREDLHECLAGSPAERYASADELAERLRTLPQRQTAEARRKAEARSARIRRKIGVGLAFSTALLLVLAAILYVAFDHARQARREAERELYFSLILAGQKALASARIDRVRQMLERCPPRLRDWEWGWLLHECNLDVRTLEGHRAGISCVAVSPDGRLVATGDSDGTTCLWDFESGRRLLSLEDPSCGGVLALAFHPHDPVLATGCMEGAVILWNTKTGDLIRSIPGHGRRVRAVAFSPDGETLATAGDDKELLLWTDDYEGTPLALQEVRGRVLAVAFSPDGGMVAAGDDQGAHIWDRQTGRLIQTIDDDNQAVWSLDLDPKGRYLATSMLGPARLWSIETGKLVHEFSGHRWEVHSVRFSPRGRSLATASADGTAKLWDLDTRKEIGSFHGHSAGLSDIDFSPDGRYLVTASADKTAKIWLTDGPRRELEPRQPTGPVFDAAFFQDGRLLVTSAYDGSRNLWNPITGRRLLDLQTLSPYGLCVAACPDGSLLAAGALDGRVTIWDVDSARVIRCIEAHDNRVSAVAFGPDGAILATASGYRESTDLPIGDKVARLWDVATGRKIKDLEGHKEPINCAAFHPKEGSLATGGWDKYVILWGSDFSTSQKLAGPESVIHCLAFSPEHAVLASGHEDGSITLWNLKTLTSNTIHAHRNAVYDLTFSPNGDRLGSASADKTARIWDLRNRGTEFNREVISFNDHLNEVRAAAFSSDGRFFVTGDADGRIILRESFPWDDRDLPERAEEYKEQYWRRFLRAAHAERNSLTAYRQFDTATFAPGRPVRVQLEIQSSASSFSVIENLPEDWTADQISQGEPLNGGHAVRWTLEEPPPIATLSYLAIPPENTRESRAVFKNAVVCRSNEWHRIQDAALPRRGVFILQEGLHPAAGYDGCDDAHILVHLEKNNTGACPYLEEGAWSGESNDDSSPPGTKDHKKILLRFNLESIPPDLRIARAELRLYAFGERNAGVANPHTLYLAPVLKPWNEGGGLRRLYPFDGRAAELGEVTFTSATVGQASWDIPGATGIADVGDVESTATAGARVPQWITFDVTQSVNDFLTTPALNHGWKISQDDRRGVPDRSISYVQGIYMYKSSEAHEAWLRPMLVLFSETSREEAMTAR